MQYVFIKSSLNRTQTFYIYCLHESVYLQCLLPIQLKSIFVSSFNLKTLPD